MQLLFELLVIFGSLAFSKIQETTEQKVNFRIVSIIKEVFLEIGVESSKQSISRKYIEQLEKKIAYYEKKKQNMNKKHVNEVNELRSALDKCAKEKDIINYQAELSKLNDQISKNNLTINKKNNEIV